MIVVLVRVEVPADAISSVKEALQTMETESRGEAGCQDYVFTTEINDPTFVRIVERWDDMAALEYHFATTHMAAFNAAMAGLDAGPIDVKTYEVTAEVALPGAS